jgi:HlyD family secretion protein
MNKKIIFLLCIALAACKAKVTEEVQTSLVKRGTFSEELIEEGAVKAVNSIAINAPNISYRYGSLKITSFIDDGKEVEKGDTVLVFDPSEVKKAIIDAEQRLVIANAELEKLIATQQSEIADLESDLEITRISLEISKINFEQSLYESDITKKEIKLKLDNANVALGRAKEQIENRKKIQLEDLFQKNLSIKQLKVVLDEGNNSVKNLFVVSPAHGIAIIEHNWMTNQKWQLGDQPYSGTKLIELPDLNEMMAEVKINEVDVSKILPGLKVVITADAYSDTSYIGEVTTIANLAQNKDYKSKIKIFPVQIKINGTPKNLLPGLTVSCKIKINEIPDVLYIPLEAIFKEQGNVFVYIKTVSGFKRRDVKIGASNTDFVIVTEGLSANDELALSDPFLNKEENKSKKDTDKNRDKLN